MSNIDKLLTLMAQLRDRENGCPWDIEQDFASIAPHTIEEAYEVADSIARNDMDDLRVELGDLLLQVVFHAQMAQEEGVFNFDDVVQAIIGKLIARHPHIFADEVITTAAQQAEKWEKLKERERMEKALLKGVANSILSDIPRNLPALIRSVKLQKRAASVGFNWEHSAQVLDKIEEEIAELREAIATNNTKNISEELGDVLFAINNLANHLHVNPEAALAGTNAKFERRFHYIEQTLATENRSPSDATLEEMDRLWNEAKLMESSLAG
jgi:ATP diphosphatase